MGMNFTGDLPESAADSMRLHYTGVGFFSQVSPRLNGPKSGVAPWI
jgi:hypothetical protein